MFSGRGVVSMRFSWLNLGSISLDIFSGSLEGSAPGLTGRHCESRVPMAGVLRPKAWCWRCRWKRCYHRYDISKRPNHMIGGSFPQLKPDPATSFVSGPTLTHNNNPSRTVPRRLSLQSAKIFCTDTKPLTHNLPLACCLIPISTSSLLRIFD